MKLAALVKRLLSEDSGRAQTFRFIISGGTNTVLTYLYFVTLYWTLDAPFWAFNISFVMGIMSSYLLNLKFTFRGTHSIKKMAKFPITYLVYYVGGITLLKVWLDLGIPAEVAGLLNVFLLAPITFLIARFILLR